MLNLQREDLETLLARELDNAEVAREFANLLLESIDRRVWTVLEPTEMKSAGGATLSKLDDNSILASGSLPEDEVYSISASALEGDVTTVRLEVLQDSSLGSGVLGREDWFHLSEFAGDLISPGTNKSVVPFTFQSVAASHSYRHETPTGAIDGGHNTRGWVVNPSQVFGDARGIAVFHLTKPLRAAADDTLQFRLCFLAPWAKRRSIGRFRLSVSDDQTAFEQEQLRFAALRLTDSWTRLAAAYHLVGDQQAFDTLLAQHPQAASLELAGFLVESGKSLLAEQRSNEALLPLLKARELFAIVAAKNPQSDWMVLQPTKMTSQGGATLTRLDDNSILASGTNPDKEVYEFETELEGGDFTAIRLEGLTHPSLAKGSHGRSDNGNVVLTEFEAEVAAAETPEDWQPIKFNNGWTNHPEASRNFENAVNGSLQNGWTTDHMGVPLDRTAIFTVETPFGHKTGTRLRIRLRHESYWAHHAFGRIRLSVTSAPNAIEAAPFQQQLDEFDLAGLEVAIGNAYGQLGQVDDAATAFNRALDLADDREARTNVVQAATAYDGVLDKLAALRREDAAFHDALARHYQTRGEIIAARSAAATARTLYERQLAAEAVNTTLAFELADLLMLDAEMATTWTILEPTELKSAGGATLTKLDDNSILASGTLAESELYTVTLKSSLPQISAIRLEALTDPSLPKNGPGRSEGGDFVLDTFRVKGAFRGASDSTTEIVLDAAVTDVFNPEHPIKPGGEWHAAMTGHGSHAHVAVYRLKENAVPADMTSLIFEMKFDHGPNWPTKKLGRFRFSVSDDPNVYVNAERRFAALRITDPWAKLAAAYHLVGDQQQLDKLLAAHPEAKSAVDSLNSLSWLRDLRASGLAIKSGNQLPDGTWDLDLEGATITDLEILKGPPISRLNLKRTAVSDLSPLRGWPLKHLNLEGTRVTDLTPLQDMPLEELILTGLPISDITALSGMPLRELKLGNTVVSDLEPLRGMPLEHLQLYNTKITDLSPLKGMPLDYLHISGTKVTDLAPLRGMPLTGLKLHNCTELTDVSPLADCKELKGITLPPNAKNIEFLRTLPKLERLSFKDGPDKTAAEFWKEYDAKKKSPCDNSSSMTAEQWKRTGCGQSHRTQTWQRRPYSDSNRHRAVATRPRLACHS